VARIVSQGKGKQRWHFKGAEKGLSLSNNNSFSRRSNLGREVRRDNWSRNTQGRGYSRSFSTTSKRTKAVSHSLTPRLKYFGRAQKKHGKNVSKKILKKKIILVPNSKKFVESLRSLISRRNKERRVWVRRNPLSKLMIKSLRMTYFKGKFLNARVFSVKLGRHLAFGVLQTMLKKRKLGMVLRKKKKAFLHTVRKQSVRSLELTAKVRKLSYRRKIKKMSLVGGKVLKKKARRSATIPELQIIARYAKYKGPKKITKQKLKGRLKAAVQRKVIKTLSLGRLLKKFKKICRRKKLKLRLKNKKKKEKKLLKRAKLKLLSGTKKILKRRSRRTLFAIQRKFTNLLRKKKLLCYTKRIKRGSGIAFSSAAFVVAQTR